LTIVVVDTNVPVVANEKSRQASPDCVIACTRKITEIMSDGKLAVDDGWRIITEYKKNLHQEGQPGVGDAFLKWVMTNQGNINRCERIKITPINPQNPNEFEEFPTDKRLKTFDPSDRKFIAVSLAHPQKPPILQAVDAKWWKFKDILKENQVTVEFLCIQDCMG
jgi:hypothetical protein